MTNNYLLSPKLKSLCLVLCLAIAAGCGSDDEDPVDCNAANLQATVSNVVDATCAQENGGFDLMVSGGSGPYELTIQGSGTQSIPSGISTIEGLAADSYNLTIRDTNGCSTTANVNINDVNNLAADSQIQASGCESSAGAITIDAIGGQEPYSYSLDGGAVQAENIFSGLGPGDYTALVTDDDGCETSLTVTVTTGVSFDNTIKAIIDTNCAVSGCHNGDDGAIPNWTSLSTIQANAANIKTRTSDGSMPPAGRTDLTTEQIQQIACWVDDGALDN